MKQFNRSELEYTARQYGFNRDTLEKVLRLNEILMFINTNSFLKKHLLLKGGTAINLAIFNLPRLSVDIDLDFTPNLTMEETREARGTITNIISEYMASEQYKLLPNSRFSHSLDSFYFRYQNAVGNSDVIKIEINYSLRAHLFEQETCYVTTVISAKHKPIQCVAPMEIFASKVNALLSRGLARDLYDVNKMISNNLFTEQNHLFRKSIIFYATVTQQHPMDIFNISSIDNIKFKDIKTGLLPVITKKERHQKFDMQKLTEPAKEYLKELLVPTDREIKYIENFLAKEYHPELLFDNSNIIKNISKHPMALWRCRKH